MEPHKNNPTYDASGDPLDMRRLAIQAELMDPSNEENLDFFYFFCLDPLSEKADSIRDSSPGIASALNLYIVSKKSLDAVITFEDNIPPLEATLEKLSDDFGKAKPLDAEPSSGTLDMQMPLTSLASDYLSAIKRYGESFYSMQMSLLTQIRLLSDEQEIEPLSLIVDQGYRDEIQRKAGSENDYVILVDAIIQLITSSFVYDYIVDHYTSSGQGQEHEESEPDIILPTIEELEQFQAYVLDFEGQEIERIYGKEG